MEINEIYEELSKVDEKLLFEIINKESKEENIFDSDIKFLEDYWERYKKILFESRDDKLILKLRDNIKETHENGGKLIFFGNGASASLASHAATDFTKQAKVRS